MLTSEQFNEWATNTTRHLSGYETIYDHNAVKFDNDFVLAEARFHPHVGYVDFHIIDAATETDLMNTTSESMESFYALAPEFVKCLEQNICRKV